MLHWLFFFYLQLTALSWLPPPFSFKYQIQAELFARSTKMSEAPGAAGASHGATMMPPKEPQDIDAWVLMAGLEDHSLVQQQQLRSHAIHAWQRERSSGQGRWLEVEE
nr:unnamed protein product [Digitaria exilis]